MSILPVASNHPEYKLVASLYGPAVMPNRPVLPTDCKKLLCAWESVEQTLSMLTTSMRQAFSAERRSDGAPGEHEPLTQPHGYADLSTLRAISTQFRDSLAIIDDLLGRYPTRLSRGRDPTHSALTHFGELERTLLSLSPFEKRLMAAIFTVVSNGASSFNTASISDELHYQGLPVGCAFVGTALKKLNLRCTITRVPSQEIAAKYRLTPLAQQFCDQKLNPQCHFRLMDIPDSHWRRHFLDKLREEVFNKPALKILLASFESGPRKIERVQFTSGYWGDPAGIRSFLQYSLIKREERDRVFSITPTGLDVLKDLQTRPS